ncbi:hypothetical protein SAMN04488055_5449 [Chitinophaga niabensis]|uniref:NVEALA protein n=1 Tax=Chitinophaga niabensis TaxID=536979 RepID=A0A1N6KAK9_9BACT|nr:hypothetical protein SAMN04488055_5449 [Chitinophaga niabensis]
MNKKTIILLLSTFVTAVSGAFASNLFIPVDGYSSMVYVSKQTIPCEFRKICDLGTFVCTATFTIGNTTYVDFGLFKLEGTECTLLLSQSTP